MSTLAGRRGMRPKMMMPFDAQPPQRKCVILNQGPDILNLDLKQFKLFGITYSPQTRFPEFIIVDVGQQTYSTQVHGCNWL